MCPGGRAEPVGNLVFLRHIPHPYGSLRLQRYNVVDEAGDTGAFASTPWRWWVTWVIVYPDRALDLLRIFRVSVVAKRGTDG